MRTIKCGMARWKRTRPAKGVSARPMAKPVSRSVELTYTGSQTGC